MRKKSCGRDLRLWSCPLGNKSNFVSVLHQNRRFLRGGGLFQGNTVFPSMWSQIFKVVNLTQISEQLFEKIIFFQFRLFLRVKELDSYCLGFGFCLLGL